MKRVLRIGIVLLFLLLVIGFASDINFIVMDGETSVAFNENDFRVFFSVIDKDQSNVSLNSNGQTMSYTTPILYSAGDTATFEFYLVNDAAQYDVNLLTTITRDTDVDSDKYTLDFTNVEAGNLSMSGKTYTKGILEISVDQQLTEPLEITFTYNISVESIEKTSYSYGSLFEKMIALNGRRDPTVSLDNMDDSIRFIGEDPNNYILIDDELFRIIGYIDGKIKLVKDKRLGYYSYDTSDSTVNSGNGINQWGSSGTYEGSDLMLELNGDYLNYSNQHGQTTWYNGENNEKTAEYRFSKGLSQATQSMMESATWYTASINNLNGSRHSLDSNSINGTYIYNSERDGTVISSCSSGSYCNDGVVRTATWTGYVALINASDYIMATAGNTTTTRAQCLSTNPHIWSQDCIDNNWLNTGSAQRLLNPVDSSSKATYVSVISKDGTIENGSASSDSQIRPSIYLNKDHIIYGGTGTYDNPFLVRHN